MITLRGAMGILGAGAVGAVHDRDMKVSIHSATGL